MAGDINRETLVEDVASLYNAYVGQGVRIDTFVHKVHPSLNIDDLGELLELYFVLTDDVIRGTHRDVRTGVLSFVDRLPDRLQRLKRTIGRTTTVTEDAVRGPINWRATVAARARRPGPSDRVFAYDEPSKRFDIPENRVLKRLLRVVDQTVDRRIVDVLDAGDYDDYRWAAPWSESTGRRRILHDALRENPYLGAVSADEPLPHEDIDRALGARSALYRDAAELLSYYRRLQRHDIYPREAKRLLKQFFLAPGPESSRIGSDGLEVLFEFYWAYKLLETISSPQLSLVRRPEKAGAVARWRDDDGRYVLYHDLDTPGGLQFGDTDRNSVAPQSDPTIVDFHTQKRRLTRAFDDFYTTVDGTNPPDRDHIKRRRPDLVVIRYDATTDELTNVFLGEVKFSDRARTVEKGVRQLVQAAATARLNGDYLAASGELFDDERIAAGLFVKRSPFERDHYPDGLAVFEYGETPGLPF